MKQIFNENDYNFTDSIITEMKLDVQSICDYLMVIDYFLGKKGSISLTFRLKNVQKLNLSLNKGEKLQLISLLTLAHISKRKRGEFVELVVESALSFLPRHKKNRPLIYCLCEEVYVE